MTETPKYRPNVPVKENVVTMGEMTAAEYLRQRARMTRMDKIGCNILCSNCPFDSTNSGVAEDCDGLQLKYPEKAAAIVQKWAEEHPAKTMLADLLEKYPVTPLNDAGFPSFCPHELGYEEKWNCVGVKCRECWNRPLEVAE